ncbi:hypothetical protein VKT23_019172 [Stygiomarasmius scandens]|uniref:Uncharacterized protein n=1 Tax=Marasmiellus scandens TaxID=2682957 RepID=A0ABR1ILY7_9AGAR
MGPIHQCLYAAVTAVYETDKIVFSNPKGRPADATVVICAVPWNFNELKTLVEDAAIAVGRRSSLLKPQRRATDEDVDECGPDYRDVEVLVGQFTRTVVNSLVYARLYAMQEMESRLTVFNKTRAVTPTLYQRDRKEYKLITRNAIVALEYDVVSIQASYGHVSITTTDGTGKAVEGKYAFTFKSESGKRKRRNGDMSEGDEMGQLEKGQFISK